MSITPPRPFILCVDDQKDVLDTLSVQLENSVLSDSFNFEYSESGPELLEVLDDLQANDEAVAVVISDQIMPQMMGSELLSHVHERSPMTNKILLTGESRFEAVIDAINRANLYRFIPKPWDKTDLLLTVEEAARAFIQKHQHDEQNHLLQRLYNCACVLNTEHDIDRMIEATMQLVLGHTMATRGCLILTNVGGLLQVNSYVFSGVKAGDKGQGLPYFAPDTSRQFPYAVMDYVLTQNQAFYCENAQGPQVEEWLQREPYVRHHKPKSMLCEPLMHQGALAGVIYLEHSYRSRAFGSTARKFLSLLAPTLAVSLRNASLFVDLKAKKEKIAEQKLMVEEQMQELRDSIAATRRIQDALLPATSDLKAHFAEAALIYRPRDVISGDFIWYRRLGHEVLFAVGDCTGHGIPGAMLSVLGANLLDRITAEMGCHQPAGILELLDQLIIKTLKQESRTVSEGIDIAVCRYDAQAMRFEFAGANRPFYHLRGGELTEIKGAKWGVGGYESDVKTYEQSGYDLMRGDRLFLFSDGIIDQFGGPSKDKKFTGRRFRQHLQESQNYPLPQAMRELELYLDGWQGSVDQTDDILVLGLEC